MASITTSRSTERAQAVSYTHLFQPFGGQILRLNGNYDPVCSGQRIDCEHPKGGLAVDEDMGVLPLQRCLLYTSRCA